MNGKASVSNAAEGIGVITLHDGKVNALSRVLLEELSEALEKAAAQPMRTVILRADPGVRVFSAGYDVRELPEGGPDPLRFATALRRVLGQIQQLRQPVIAMVEGSVWGGACELVFACDLIVTGDDTTFAFTPAKLGIPYDLEGMASLLAGAGGHLLQEMLFLAQPVAATRLEACGIVNRVVSRTNLERCALEMAQQIARNAPLVNRVLKEELRARSISSRLQPEDAQRLQALRQQVFASEDYREGIRAFREKRVAEFHGK